jgi:hypothetical protein
VGLATEKRVIPDPDKWSGSTDITRLAGIGIKRMGDIKTLNFNEKLSEK